MSTNWVNQLKIADKIDIRYDGEDYCEDIKNQIITPNRCTSTLYIYQIIDINEKELNVCDMEDIDDYEWIDKTSNRIA